MRIESYLFFNGHCEEAINFYRKTLGARVSLLVRFRDNPDKSAYPPGAENKIMHAMVSVDGNTIMMSDGACDGDLHFTGISISLTLKDDLRAERIFNGLSDGGQVQMPFVETFWAEKFGLVTDRFGVSWMITVGD
ncbi:VOC family protein [Marinibactrum halimedae]|nr:VOC family protein [Marinibactrum halimedae]MCD9458941.1 VOC family protein [Marinibactrum halimedae]